MRNHKFILLTLSVLSTIFYISNAQENDPNLTEIWDPVPAKVTPSENNNPPSDAIVLFNGHGLEQWIKEDGTPAAWDVKDGILTIDPGKGSIKTKQSFGDCQLHIEWRTPSEIKGEGQGRGNSGVFLQSRYELQILDSYNNLTYSNGQAASIYKQHIPLVNASKKPGVWQSYDVFYTAPIFNNDSLLLKPAYITVVHNGVLVQNHVEIKGSVAFIGQPKYTKHASKEPLLLQNHGNPVSFRNIWIRDIQPPLRPLFNGKNLQGWYSFLEKRGKNQDPDSVFKVEKGIIHISGKEFGYICTRESFRNFKLIVEFKWGKAKYPPRDKDKRDSGILYLFADSCKDNVWPTSYECQVQEGDCGDFYLVGGVQLDTKNKFENTWGLKHIIRSENIEKSNDEWNTIEIVCLDGNLQHFVNGHLVNSGRNPSVREGKILIQSEGAEVYYRRIDIIPYD